MKHIMQLFKKNREKAAGQELVEGNSENKILIFISVFATSILVGDFVFITRFIDMIKKL